MAAPMPSNLLLYEKDNNLLLKALRVRDRPVPRCALRAAFRAQRVGRVC
jgi:hypothetical protein